VGDSLGSESTIKFGGVWAISTTLDFLCGGAPWMTHSTEPHEIGEMVGDQQVADAGDQVGLKYGPIGPPHRA
jgi:hypothetical protein